MPKDSRFLYSSLNLELASMKALALKKSLRSLKLVMKNLLVGLTGNSSTMRT